MAWVQAPKTDCYLSAYKPLENIFIVKYIVMYFMLNILQMTDHFENAIYTKSAMKICGSKSTKQRKKLITLKYFVHAM